MYLKNKRLHYSSYRLILLSNFFALNIGLKRPNLPRFTPVLMTQKHLLKVYAALVVSMIFWSMTFVWYKDAYVYLKPMTTIFLRLLISSVFLYGFCKFTGKLQKIKKEDLKLVLLMAFFEPFMYFMGESFGMQLVSPTVGAVIITTIPVFTPIMAWFAFNEKITWLNILGIVLSFFGVLLVVLGDNLSFSASPLGVSFLMVAVVAAIGYTGIIVKLSKKYNTYTIITTQNSIGVVLFLPFAFIFESDCILNLSFNFDMLLPLFELAIFGSSLAFILFTYGIKHIGASRANMFTNIIPVFTAFFAFIKYGDPITLKIIGGIVVVMFGLFLSQVSRLKGKNVL